MDIDIQNDDKKTRQEIMNTLRSDFEECCDILLAVGDKTRQEIILTLLDPDFENGVRVGEITKRTYLSRPAVSHHLKQLLSCGIIDMRKEGTMNFYYLSGGSKISSLRKLTHDIKKALEYREYMNKNQ